MKIYDVADAYNLVSPKTRHNEEKHIITVLEKPGPIFEAFQLIVKTSALFGITFKKYNACRNVFTANFWDTINEIMALVTYIFSISSLHYMAVSPQVLLTFYVYLSLGFMMRTELLLKRQNVSFVVFRLSSMYKRLDFKSSSCPLNLKYQVAVLIICVVSLFPIMIFYFIKLFNEETYFKFMSFEIPGASKTYVVNTIRFSLTYSTTSATAVISLALILCCNFYVSADQIVKEYGKSFSKGSGSKYLSNITLISYISTYKTVIQVIREVNNCVSKTCLYLYAAAVCCFFNTLSMLFSDFQFSADMISCSQMSITFIMALVIFFALTYSGSRISSTYESLKFRIMESSEHVFSRYYDTQMLATFKMLAECINGSQPSFTGGGMFTISKGLILTTAGALITYGVVIFQVP